MTEGTTPTPEPPEPGSSPDEQFPVPPFNERAARRAVWRGVFRTALSALLLIVAVLLIAEFASSAWQRRGDRGERFQDVLGVGFLVAQPGWRGELSGCCNANLTSIELSLDVAPRTASGESQTTPAWLRLNLLGRVEIDSIPILPDTPVDRALGARRPANARTRKLLTQLPQRMVATAIVELAAPATVNEFNEILVGTGVRPLDDPMPSDMPPVFLQPPYREPVLSKAGMVRTLTWPESFSAATEFMGGAIPEADSLAQFKAWAAELRDDDDRNLGRLGLPPADTIKSVARNARVHAFILETASLRQLTRLLDDPAIRSVNVADVAFDLGYEGKDGDPF